MQDRLCSSVQALLSEAASSPVSAIEKAIAHPELIHFAQFLDVPQVAALAESNALVYKTLLLFAYGTMEDHTQEIPLNEPALTKLRELSLISYASKERFLSYDQLMTRLGLSSTRQVEDLIIDAIYKDFIDGKMDSQKSLIEIYDFAARDVRQEEVAGMAALVDEWLARASLTAEQFNKQADLEDQQFKETRQRTRETELSIKEAKKNWELTIRNEQMDLPIMHSSLTSSIYQNRGGPGPGPSGGPQRRKTRGGAQRTAMTSRNQNPF